MSEHIRECFEYIQANDTNQFGQKENERQGLSGQQRMVEETSQLLMVAVHSTLL